MNIFIDTDKEESQFKNTVLRGFKDWEKQVQDNYTQVISKALSPEDYENIYNFKIGSTPKRLASIATAIFQKGAQKAALDMNVVMSWNIDMQAIASFYVQHYEEFSKILADDLQKRIKEMISEAVKEGTPSTEVHQQIADIFAGPVTIKVPEKKDDEGNITRQGYEYEMDKDTYTTMVSRTEIQRAVNNGRVSSYDESNLAKTLRYVANPGACEICMPHNGEVQPVAETLDVIPRHPNCRCTWVVQEYKKFGEQNV